METFFSNKRFPKWKPTNFRKKHVPTWKLKIVFKKTYQRTKMETFFRKKKFPKWKVMFFQRKVSKPMLKTRGLQWVEGMFGTTNWLFGCQGQEGTMETRTKCPKRRLYSLKDQLKRGPRQSCLRHAKTSRPVTLSWKWDISSKKVPKIES